MDKFSKKKRSEIMSKIYSRNSKFEQNFICIIRSLTKKRFKRNVSLIEGKPDIVFKKEKFCIFLDSDFWHGWQYPRWKASLKNDFWRTKIEKNRKRDKRITIKLKKEGWIVLRIWEHQIKKNLDKVKKKIIKNF